LKIENFLKINKVKHRLNRLGRCAVKKEHKIFRRSTRTKFILRAQNKMAAFLLKFYTGGGALPFSQTTGNLKMELSGDIACVGQKK
jgi:hypothetical protein